MTARQHLVTTKTRIIFMKRIVAMIVLSLLTQCEPDGDNHHLGYPSKVIHKMSLLSCRSVHATVEPKISSSPSA